jgi:demethylmenaquinone methyltransferase/2-methoxy-6-polyprenyl-1,4-benzoquinol methylase
MHVLDIATGTGLVAREAIGLGGRVIGLDPSVGMISKARRYSFPLVRALGEQLPFRDACFDFISMGFALRHVGDIDALFAEMWRVLKRGGTICLLEVTHPTSRFAAWTLRFFMTRIVPAIAYAARREGDALMRFYWDTIEACVPPATILAAGERAGFRSPTHRVIFGTLSEYVIRKE